MIDLHCGDCLEIMKDIPDNSIDLILTDPPYGVTAEKWDNIINFTIMWKEIKRICKDTSPIVLFSSQPFSSKLISSNMKDFKYQYVWIKNIATNFLHAKYQPLRKHEDILVFYNMRGKFYPIKSEGHAPTQSAKGSSKGVLWHGNNKRDYKGGDTDRFPTTILNFDVVDPKQRMHPTQKPVALLEYLIKTYTKENEVVLDFTMGSGSSGVAARNTNRSFIGIELNEEYFNIAKERINIATLSDFL